MKKLLILGMGALTVLVATYVVFGQTQDERRQRFAQYRQRQREAVEAIVQQANELKAQMDEADSQPRPDFQSMSEEERTKVRESFQQRREQQQVCIAAIEQRLIMLKGPRQLRQEHEESIAKLREIHELALTEKAKSTAEAVQKLISSKEQEFEKLQEKLGFGQR